MTQNLENYVNAKKPMLERQGMKISVKNAEVMPKLFKLNITLEVNQRAATFIVWDEGSQTPAEAYITILRGATPVLKCIEPKRAQELFDAFDEVIRDLA